MTASQTSPATPDTKPRRRTDPSAACAEPRSVGADARLTGRRCGRPAAGRAGASGLPAAVARKIARLREGMGLELPGTGPCAITGASFRTIRSRCRNDPPGPRASYATAPDARTRQGPRTGPAGLRFRRPAGVTRHGQAVWRTRLGRCAGPVNSIRPIPGRRALPKVLPRRRPTGGNPCVHSFSAPSSPS